VELSVVAAPLHLSPTEVASALAQLVAN
jgi:hypothetical protein